MQSYLGFPLKIRRQPHKRRLTLKIKPTSEIVVSCGKIISEAAIQDFLDKHRSWIEKSQAKFAKLRAQHPKFEARDGARLLFLGQWHTLKVISPPGELEYVTLAGQEIWAVSKPENALEVLREFYKKEGILRLSWAVQVFSKQMNLKPAGVSFRCQKTRWGSCSSTGKLNLNWRVVAFPIDTLEYLVVHELAHLKHKNHSASFWQLVAEHIPNYKLQNQRLRELQYYVDFLCAKSELHD